MAMTTDSIPAEPVKEEEKPAEQPKAVNPEPKEFYGKKGKPGTQVSKPTLRQKLLKSDLKMEMYRNDTENPVGIRLDSFDRREFIWLNPGESERIPCEDVRNHKLTLIRE